MSLYLQLVACALGLFSVSLLAGETESKQPLKKFDNGFYQLDFQCHWKKATGLWEITYGKYRFGGLNFLRANYKLPSGKVQSVSHRDTMDYHAVRKGKNGQFQTVWDMFPAGKAEKMGSVSIRADLLDNRIDVTCQAKNIVDVKLNRHQQTLFNALHVFSNMKGWMLAVRKTDGTMGLGELPEKLDQKVWPFNGNLTEIRLSKEGHVLTITAGKGAIMRFYYYDGTMEIHIGNEVTPAGRLPKNTISTWSYSLVFERE